MINEIDKYLNDGYGICAIIKPTKWGGSVRYYIPPKLVDAANGKAILIIRKEDKYEFIVINNPGI